MRFTSKFWILSTICLASSLGQLHCGSDDEGDGKIRVNKQEKIKDMSEKDQLTFCEDLNKAFKDVDLKAAVKGTCTALTLVELGFDEEPDQATCKEKVNDCVDCAENPKAAGCEAYGFDAEEADAFDCDAEFKQVAESCDSTPEPVMECLLDMTRTALNTVSKISCTTDLTTLDVQTPKSCEAVIPKCKLPENAQAPALDALDDTGTGDGDDNSGDDDDNSGDDDDNSGDDDDNSGDDDDNSGDDDDLDWGI